MEKTKVAMVGLGGIVQIMHLPALKKMNEVEITAVCDSDESKAKSLSSKHDIKSYYKEVNKMLEDKPEIKAVIISAPTDVHKKIAVTCLKAGKDVFVEKPIARNLSETQDIVNAAEKNKRKIMVGMNNRFRNDAMLERSFVKGKELGDIYYVKTGWLKAQSSSQRWFMEMEKAGGGVFFDNGIAMLDLGLWMLGFPKVKSVTAINYYHNTKSVEDSNFSLIKFKNGSSMTIEVSWNFVGDSELYYCNVFGVDGSATINPLRIFKKVENEIFNITPKNIKAPKNVVKNSYEYELKHFIGAVRGDHKMISTGKDALSVMQIAEAIYDSAKKEKEVTFK
jgi:predicted dehydrogenase